MITDSRQETTTNLGLTPLALRVRGEFTEMPGMRLTVRQAARLLGLSINVASDVLEELRQASVLKCSETGCYSLRN